MCYAGDVELQSPIESEVHLSVGNRRWTVEELVERSPEFFVRGRSFGVAPMPSGIGS